MASRTRSCASVLPAASTQRIPAKGYFAPHVPAVSSRVRYLSSGIT